MPAGEGLLRRFFPADARKQKCPLAHIAGLRCSRMSQGSVCAYRAAHISMVLKPPSLSTHARSMLAGTFSLPRRRLVLKIPSTLQCQQCGFVAATIAQRPWMQVSHLARYFLLVAAPCGQQCLQSYEWTGNTENITKVQIRLKRCCTTWQHQPRFHLF